MRLRARIYVGLELYESAVEDYNAALECGKSTLNASDIRATRDELLDAEEMAAQERANKKDFYTVLGRYNLCGVIDI